MATSLLDDALAAARTEILKDGGTCIIRATQLQGSDPPASGEYIMLDLIPTAPSNAMDGSLYEDLNLQVGSWSDVSLTSAIANAEAARARLAAIGYDRTGGIQFLLEDGFVGVFVPMTQVAAFDNLT